VLRALFAGATLFLARVLRTARIVAVGVTVGPPLADRLSLAAIALAFGAATLVGARVFALFAACGGTFGPATLTGFGLATLCHSLAMGRALPTRNAAAACSAARMTAR
jgi:hypothetical protein